MEENPSWFCMNCSRKRRSVRRVLVAKPEGKRTLGSPKRRWEDNFNMYLKRDEVSHGLD
jgi:hypothetical protein